MDKKGKVYVALSLGCRSSWEISGRCEIPIEEILKICWDGVKKKEIRYETYKGFEIMNNVLHFYLTHAGRQEMRIICLEERLRLLEIWIHEKIPE